MLENIKEIILAFADVEAEEIKESSNLRTDLGLNSLDNVSIAQEIEAKFGIAIPNNILPSFKTVGDFLRYLEKNQ